MKDLDTLINELELDFDEEELREAAVYAARVAFVTVVDRLLHNQGWNRTRLAKEMGLTKSRISQILSESSDVTFSNVAAILFCLGIDMSNMLHQAAKPQASSWSFDSNAQKSIPKVTHNWQYDMDGEKRGLSQSESANVGLIWGGSCDDNSPLFC